MKSRREVLRKTLRRGRTEYRKVPREYLYTCLLGTPVYYLAYRAELHEDGLVPVLAQLLLTATIVVLGPQCLHTYRTLKAVCAEEIRNTIGGTYLLPEKLGRDVLHTYHWYQNAAPALQETYRGITRELEHPPNRQHREAAELLAA